MHQGPPPFGFSTHARKDWEVKCEKMLAAQKPQVLGIGGDHVAAPSCAETEEEVRAPAAAPEAAPAAAEDALKKVYQAADAVQSIKRKNELTAADKRAKRTASWNAAVSVDEAMWKEQLRHLPARKPLDVALGWLRAGFSLPTADFMGLQCKGLQVVADSEEVAELEKQGRPFTACMIDNVEWASADWKGDFFQRWNLGSDLTQDQLLAALNQVDADRSWTDKNSWEQVCKARGPRGDAEDEDDEDDDDVCAACSEGGQLVLCDGCNAGYHLECMKPTPLTTVPDGEWRCHRCKEALLKKAQSGGKCSKCKGSLGKLQGRKPITCGSCKHIFHVRCVGLRAVPNDEGWTCPTCSPTDPQVGHCNDELG